LRKCQHKYINCVINSTFRKIFNTRSEETVDVCLEMFIVSKLNRQLRYVNAFLNKFSVINNALCQVFVVNAKKELELCCTDVY